MTEDAELTRALALAAPFAASGASWAKQVRDLAIAGARHVAGGPSEQEERLERLRRLAASFDDPAHAAVDLDRLRDSKRDAWRAG